MNPVFKALEDFNQSIRDDIFSKGINDTGDAANSLRVVEIDNSHWQSVGSDYIEILDRGRGPGKGIPVDTLNDWIKRKMGITDDKEMKRVAFFIQRKAKNEGNAIFRGEKEGLNIDDKIETLKEKLMPELAAFEKAEVIKHLNKFKLKW